MADLATLGAASLPRAVAAMAGAGIRWIQLRAKPRPPAPPLADRDLLALAERCAAALEATGAHLWIDDRADVAALLRLGGLPVSGLHLGQRDLPPTAARRVVGDDLWIGLSTHDEAQLAAAAEDPEVDVVAVGPVYATASKHRPDPVVGLDLVRRARAVLDRAAAAAGLERRPLVAIGGIDAENLGAVLAAGADAVAVLGAACRGDVGESCRALLAAAAATRPAAGGRPGPPAEPTP